MTARAPEQAGTVIVRDGVVVYASEGVAALGGRLVGDILGRPFTEFIVPEQRDAVLERYERRVRGEVVPPGVEITLVLPGGGRRVVEAHAERDGADVLVHLRDLTLRDARRLRLEAVASLGAALQRERTEEAIHARVAKGLFDLGLSSTLLRVETKGVRIVWASTTPEFRARFQALTGSPPDGYLGLPNAFSAAVVREGYVFSEDWARDASGIMPDRLVAAIREAVQEAGASQAIGVRLDERDGCSRILVVGGDWLREDDGPAVRLFGAQVAAALDAARTIADLSQRNAQLTLLVDVARDSSHHDPVLLLEAALQRICQTMGGEVGLAYLRDGDRLVLLSTTGVAPDAVHPIADLPLGDGAPGLALQRLEPVLTDVASAFPAASAALSRCGPLGPVIAVPLLAKSAEAVGAIVLARAEGTAFGDGDPALLSSIGVQLGVALDAARLFSDVRRRLADLEAVHALAVRVHANAPGDVGALLQDGCRDIARALSATGAALLLASEDRTLLRAAASCGIPRVPLETTVELARDPLSAGVMRDRVPCVSEDIIRDPRSVFHGRPDVPPRSILAVPLASRADVRGVVYVADRPGRRFSAGDVALANALAGALGVGLENAELYADARRRVEELFLLNEVGRAVSGSLELGAVLREAAEGARRIARTTGAFVLLYEPARDELRFGAGAGTDGEALEDLRGPAPPGSILERVLRERRPQTIEDAEGSGVAPAGWARVGGRAFAAVPVLLRGEPLGVLVADEERGPRRFAEPDVERLTAVADRLAVAIENARLYHETRRRAEELGLVHEVGRSLVETLDIEQVLGGGVRNLARIVDAPDAYLMLASEDGEWLEMRAVAGTEQRLRHLRLPLSPSDHNLATRVFASREPLVVEDGLSDPRVQQELRAASGARAFLVLPLVVRDHAIGAVVIVETRGPRLFTPAEVERGAAIANQLAVAAENARLYEDLRRSYAELARAQQQLIQGERLAALGELSAVVAHEVRNPLGVIFNSLGSLRRLVRPSGDAKTLFDIVEEEAERLNRIVGDLLDFARPSTPQLRPELLDRVVEDAVAAALSQQGKHIELVRDLDPSIPPVAMDARLVRQAVLNVAVNAVQAMPRGGRITIRTRREGSDALLEVADTGSGIPDEVKERIFEPFFTTKASGTGLGLAVVKRIVEGHGGRIGVRSAPGDGTVFALRFPLDGPQGP